MTTAERTAELRKSMAEHLEAALACADETQDGQVRYLIESALDALRAAWWPTLDSRQAPIDED